MDAFGDLVRPEKGAEKKKKKKIISIYIKQSSLLTLLLLLGRALSVFCFQIAVKQRKRCVSALCLA